MRYELALWPADLHDQSTRHFAYDMESISERDSEVVVLSNPTDPLILAEVGYRIGSRPALYLVSEDGACIRVILQTEIPVDRAELQQALRSGKRVQVDAAVSPASRRALGL